LRVSPSGLPSKGARSSGSCECHGRASTPQGRRRIDDSVQGLRRLFISRRSPTRSCRSRRVDPTRVFIRRKARRGGPPTASAFDTSGDGGGHVGVNAEQSRGSCRAISSEIAFPQSPPCATYFVYRGVASASPCFGDADRFHPAPSACPKSRIRQRRNNEVEGVRRACAMRRGIGQRIDDLQLFDDGAGQPCVTIIGSAFSCLERT